ncbi:PhzF family phenazine biosynthesis isomerase [Paenibacillus antibioticophila]|uniref:PhzF family phenazine biosynthesis isomerase n=1 Tax=Paenibacillus antibioticophila TaxID=1274374 RepID=UPI0005C9713A|nr:PhzF family phenazine biosynthesis isomerase [Paenibacillus antibioticophila]
MKVFHIEAFTNTPNLGNPAGVVLSADNLQEDEMLNIAKRVGFNETVFVHQSTVANFKLKYFTPGHEINLCGHATMAAMHCLKSNGLINENPISIETNVGILPIFFEGSSQELIRMQQGNPEFMPFTGSIERLMNAIGLSIHDLDSRYPVIYGSTGTWTVLIPIKKLESFNRMVPNNKEFPNILLENSRASIHPFCLETKYPDSLMHARHFSSPYSGTVEDPVTGTASGVMGAYYLNYIMSGTDSVKFTVEQGQEINRDGRVFVEANRIDQELMEIYISGNAVFVKEIEI